MHVKQSEFKTTSKLRKGPEGLLKPQFANITQEGW